MTARRRRKSGSGPSAPALIAWIGGQGAAGTLDTRAPVARASTASSSRGLAVGTLLACGSVLAVAVHAADSPSAPARRGPLPGLATAGSEVVSSGYGATSLAMARSAVAPAGAPSARVSPAPTGNHIRSGPVVRNIPLALGPVSAATTKQPTTKQPATKQPTTAQSLPLSVPAGAGSAAPPAGPVQSPVQDPAEDPVDNVVTPVTRVVAAVTRQVEPVQDTNAPVDVLAAPVEDEGSQPAMTLLCPSW